MTTKTLAIHGGLRAKSTPYGAGKRFGKEEEDAVLETLRSQDLFYVTGKRVFETERIICELYGVEHAVLCSSGTAAVHTALAVCGVEAGDEVIVNPVSDWGTVLGILALQAVPVFCDIDESTFSLDPKAVAAAITPKTKAIILVHLYGYPARAEEIAQIARSKGIKLIEDCAQTAYGFIKGQPVGTFGDVNAFSTNDSKHISSGEGGYVITRDSHLAKMARLFTDKGYQRNPSPPRGKQNVAFVAYNYRMSELNAAVLGVQLKSLPSQIKARQRFHDRLLSELGSIQGYSPLEVLAGCQGAYWAMLGRLDLGQFSVNRDQILEALVAEGIPASPSLSPCGVLYKNAVFRNKTPFLMSQNRSAEFLASRDYRDGLCPLAEKILDSVLIIDCKPYFNEVDAIETAAGIRKVLEFYRR